ncbi:hypothetical protein A3D71_03880 [Candidatus Kaiserbacteria bacterium RIFCSPHIGHO2_02_FULL_55_20]|uniref:N-acetyltransferase domain-containing protein n=1 Tax=Candidatus Kaiserbacteria bacterium RIFCSPHIGHO2_02_FULL_55_20 TaxID=1798497 RepID=A0A1F6DWD7_9BACT|nr:MAG: hypothetical protein A3D71_03880 [Candidatus Kaiserbacteria bacterium RIFCSPHIGHO2_02_FULL_55_20]
MNDDGLESSNKYAWEPVRPDDPRSLNDLFYLHTLAKEEYPSTFANPKVGKGQFTRMDRLEPTEGAMILRQNSQAIGCIKYETFGQGHKTLYVTFVYVLPDKRNASVIRSLLRTIRTVANDCSADSVAWSGTDETENMYKKIDKNAQSGLRRSLAHSRMKNQDPRAIAPDYVVYTHELNEENILSLFHQPNQEG